MSTPSSDKEFQKLLAADWEWSLVEYPEFATHLGDNRYNHRLTNLSPEAIQSRKAHEREMLSQIRKIDRRQLTEQDAISYDLFLLDKQLAVEAERFPIELMPLSQMEGPQIGIGQLIASMPFETVIDFENYLERLRALPMYLNQVIELLRRGIDTGWTPPAGPLRSVPAQIEEQMLCEEAEGPFYRPFLKFSQAIPVAARSRLQAEGNSLIRTLVVPALKQFHAFVTQTYLSACRSDIAAGALKDGSDYYEYEIRRLTTTDRNPREIYDIGQQEVSRIRRQMEELIQGLRFNGSFHEFLNFLRTDSRFYYTNPLDLISGYSLIAKRIDAELPRLFYELPRAPYGIREVPDYEAPAQTTAYYLPGAADGSRAGYFYVNTYKLDTRPKYEMEALSLHEAVPGHHLQIARAQELKNLPDFRRNGRYTAYVEGWALYAENLGEDIGFYSDEYSRFGRLTYEMWRACRLVVDTGIHAFNWSREKAIEFMLQNTAKSENDVTVEIDRYIVWPAQALAYKLGELKIKELRARAKERLGGKFDLRRFHNAVLDNGPLPLNVLDRVIADWMNKQ